MCCRLYHLGLCKYILWCSHNDTKSPNGAVFQNISLLLEVHDCTSILEVLESIEFIPPLSHEIFSQSKHEMKASSWPWRGASLHETQAAIWATGYVLMFIHISGPHKKSFHSYSSFCKMTSESLNLTFVTISARIWRLLLFRNVQSPCMVYILFGADWFYFSRRLIHATNKIHNGDGFSSSFSNKNYISGQVVSVIRGI